jgi:flavin reductase (DIM6/NTAB) family NADH-FMN oxidoreductase RutF
VPKRRLEPGPFIVPMPTVLVGSTVDGRPNYMTAAFVGIANYKPAVIGCGLSPTHRTSQGIEEQRTFSINLPSPQQVAVTDYCGLHSGAKVDKGSLFETFYGDLETAPMICECALTAECRLLQTVTFAVDTLYLGEIVSVFADEGALESGELDWERVAPMLFTFPDRGYWRLGSFVARAWEVGKGFVR